MTAKTPRTYPYSNSSRAWGRLLYHTILLFIVFHLTFRWPHWHLVANQLEHV